jgi:hypothetical protein
MHYSLKVCEYPNNEIRATIYRVTSRNTCDDTCDAGPDAVGGDFDSGLEFKGDSVSVPDLDISAELSRKSPPGYGGVPKITKFGLNARRTISRCAGVFERDKIPNCQCLFLTGTIPGSTKEAFNAVAKWSSWLVKSIKTWISNCGVVDNYSLYCWEFQSRGALHIHYLVLVKDPVIRQVVMWKWAIKWGQLIDAVGRREGIDMWRRSDGSTWADRRSVLQAPAQFVRHSVGSYLSDYLSKNAPEPGKNIVGECMNPVRWWGASRPLLQRMRELSNQFEVEVVGNPKYGRVWTMVRAGLHGAANGFHEYCDRLGFARVAVAFCEDAGLIYDELWRDLKCKWNHGTVAKCLTVWQPSPGSLVRPTSGRIWTKKLSVNMQRFAVRTLEVVSSPWSCGKGTRLFKARLLNIELRKRPRQLILQM